MVELHTTVLVPSVYGANHHNPPNVGPSFRRKKTAGHGRGDVGGCSEPQMSSMQETILDACQIMPRNADDSYSERAKSDPAKFSCALTSFSAHTYLAGKERAQRGADPCFG